MLIKILNSALIIFAVYMGLKQGWPCNSDPKMLICSEMEFPAKPNEINRRSYDVQRARFYFKNFLLGLFSDGNDDPAHHLLSLI